MNMITITIRAANAFLWKFFDSLYQLRIKKEKLLDGIIMMSKDINLNKVIIYNALPQTSGTT